MTPQCAADIAMRNGIIAIRGARATGSRAEAGACRCAQAQPLRPSPVPSTTLCGSERLNLQPDVAAHVADQSIQLFMHACELLAQVGEDLAGLVAHAATFESCGSYGM